MSQVNDLIILQVNVIRKDLVFIKDHDLVKIKEHDLKIEDLHPFLTTI